MNVNYGYARGSTWEQAMTLDAQMEAIEAYHKANLSHLAWGEVYQERGISAFKWRFTDRPVGAVLDRRLERGDHVTIAKLDRAFRNAREALETIDVWRERGVTLHITSINIDTDSPWGRCMLTVMAAFAEMERTMIAERTREVLAWCESQGLRHTREAGYGFRWERIRGVKGKTGKPKYRKAPDPAERAVMAEIAQRSLEGWTFRDIFLDFAERGIKTREGKQWSEKRIARACTAEFLLRSKEPLPTNTNGAAGA